VARDIPGWFILQGSMPSKQPLAMAALVEVGDKTSVGGVGCIRKGERRHGQKSGQWRWRESENIAATSYRF